MTKQILKSYQGYEVVYDDNRKHNPFIVKRHNKVITAYADTYSACSYVISCIGYHEKLDLQAMK